MRDEEGRELHWPLSNYGEEGPREENWFAGGVLKHHRKLSTMLNDLTAAGLTVERVEEPEEAPTPGGTGPFFPQNRHSPSVLVIRSAKSA